MNYRIAVRLLAAIFCFLFVIPANLLKAQIQIPERIFYDTVTSVSDKGKVTRVLADGGNIYISGGFFAENHYLEGQYPLQPAVSKLDTAGNVIWTAASQEQYPDYGSLSSSGFFSATCDNTIKAGNRIYTIANFSQSYPKESSELWSIDDLSGTITWRKKYKEVVLKVVDYNSTELIVLSEKFNSPDFFDCTYFYTVVDKASGVELFRKTLTVGTGSFANTLSQPYAVYVDTSKNVLLSHFDTCWKYRDSRLTQLHWTASEFGPSSDKNIVSITQQSNRYLLLSRNYVKAVDTATGVKLFFKHVQVGVVASPPQSGDDGVPRSFLVKDSLLYITWTAPYVPGNMKSGFTLTRMNCINGYVKFNVAYDMTGVPADTWTIVNDPPDWPFHIAMDASRNVYLTGSFDGGEGSENVSAGNWGIVKINGESGARIWEASITQDSANRKTRSKGIFVHYNNGRMYCVGNLERKLDPLFSNPYILSFDTSSTYVERYRKGITSGYRYPSSLVDLKGFSATKMVLLKQVGRSAIIEMRTNTDQFLWSKTISLPTKFVEPGHLTITADKKIAVSCISYLQDTYQPLYKSHRDSLLFFKIDSLGNTSFSHRMKANPADSLKVLQTYADNNNATNFLYIKKCNSCGNGRSAFGGYTLDSTWGALSEIILHPRLTVSTMPQTRINPVQHIRGDTMGLFLGAGVLSIAATRQSSIGYRVHSIRRIPKFALITSSVKADSLSYVLTGIDSSNNALAMYYQYNNADSVRWFTSLGQGIIYNADTTAAAIYTVAQKADLSLLITKQEKANGTINWQRQFTAAPGSYYIPIDLASNNSKNRFTVGGLILDTTIKPGYSSYFVITFDSAGAIIKNEIRPGYALGNTRINSIEVLNGGLTMAGGALTTSFGLAGFYNSTDTAASIITGVNTVVRDDFFLNIFPNPASNNVVVQFSNPVFQKQVSISILNAAGQVLKTYQLSNISPGQHQQPLLLQASPGLYFIELKGTGKLRSVKPLLIIR